MQQFINSKTNRNIEFSYQTVSVDSVKIGIFHIPIQERPFYIKKSFGKVLEEKVYIRRSTTTGTAKPDEVSKMGCSPFDQSELSVAPRNPNLELLKKEFEEGNTIIVEDVFHKFDRRRYDCHIEQLTEVYAVFNIVSGGGKLSSALSRISISFESSRNMKLITIAPIG